MAGWVAICVAGIWGDIFAVFVARGHTLILAAIDDRVQSIVSQIPVVDGYENLRRVHGTMGYGRLAALMAEDRLLRYDEPGNWLYLPHAAPDPNT